MDGRYDHESDKRRTPQEKYVILFDTAKKCLLILDQLYIGFEKAMIQATDDSKVAIDSTIVIRSYISAHGLVDYFDRFYEIIKVIPLIPKKHPKRKELLEYD
ncbi:hypothetical protein K8S19_04670 [bacterium]|nr:hypothetical protein [bacterium]